jgi:hypothetical protein
LGKEDGDIEVGSFDPDPGAGAGADNGTETVHDVTSSEAEVVFPISHAVHVVWPLMAVYIPE